MFVYVKLYLFPMKIRLGELRQLIREELERNRLSELLREAEAGVGLSGKSLSLVARLEEINRDLEVHDLQVGIVQGVSPQSETRFRFSVRSLTNPIESSPVPEESSDRLKVAKKLSGAPSESIRDALEKVPYGWIDVSRPDGKGECSGALVVKYTAPTADGWGPLLYDLAMEFATQQGGGLASDRGDVSSSARGVWSKYDTARPDVTPVQLDRKGGERKYKLTPDDPSDDCSQDMVMYLLNKLPNSDEAEWSKSPLSRAYLKTDGAVMASLESAGLLWQ